MTERERRLWIDAKGRPAITTTANGARNATRWGWTPATAIPVSDGGCEAAYQRIKAEEAPHWRISEHAAFEQGWKACQADTRARPMTERDGERLDQIVRDAYGYWPPARAEILKLIEAVRQEERAAREEVEERLGLLLWHLTDGRMSKANYTVDAMRALIDEVQEKWTQEVIKEARQEERERIATRAAIRSAALFERAWDEGNAMGLDGWTGPERGEEPDQHAIDRRERTVDRLVDEMAARIREQGKEQDRG